MRQSVLFTGPCGVDKTTVGRLAAEKLDMPFYDLDKLRGRLYAGAANGRENKASSLMKVVSASVHACAHGSRIASGGTPRTLLGALHKMA